jgi:hypothetical protein
MKLEEFMVKACYLDYNKWHSYLNIMKVAIGGHLE